MPTTDLDRDDYVLALDSIYDDALSDLPLKLGADTCTELEPFLAQHRKRAGRITQELTSLRACRQLLAAALHLIGIGVFVVDGERKVVFLNAAAEALHADHSLFTICDGSLATSDRSSDAKLQKAIGAALNGSVQQDGNYILLKHLDRPIAAVVVPTPRDRDKSVAAIVLVSDPSAQVDAGNAFLARAHGMTASEARLMKALATGGSLVAAAASLNIAPTTARTHLKNIFAKTQIERQTELMRLVATVAPPTHRVPEKSG